MPSPEYQKYRKFLEQGAFSEAARLAEKQYLGGDKKNPFWLTRQAGALSRAGKYNASLAVARQALELEASDAYALLAAAEALAGLKRFEEARSFYEEIADHPKLAPFARRGILASLAPGKNWSRMLQLLAAWNLPEIYDLPWRVQALTGQGRIDEAFDACRRWLALKPDHPRALWALTDLEIRRDGMDAVLKRMGKIARIASRPPIYKQIYASLCRKAGKPEIALQQYDKLSGTGIPFGKYHNSAFYRFNFRSFIHGNINSVILNRYFISIALQFTKFPNNLSPNRPRKFSIKFKTVFFGNNFRLKFGNQIVQCFRFSFQFIFDIQSFLFLGLISNDVFFYDFNSIRYFILLLFIYSFRPLNIFKLLFIFLFL